MFQTAYTLRWGFYKISNFSGDWEMEDALYFFFFEGPKD
jgi:hypothetical protein